MYNQRLGVYLRLWGHTLYTYAYRSDPAGQDWAGAYCKRAFKRSWAFKWQKYATYFPKHYSTTVPSQAKSFALIEHSYSVLLLLARCYCYKIGMSLRSIVAVC